MPNQQFTIDPSGQKKVILSIDGGGMRGAIAIAMLAELEKQTGKPCSEIFDMVAGTSTGAIIAVGLAVGLKAKDIMENVYRDGLPRAFQRAGDNGFVGAALGAVLKLLGVEDSEFLTRLASHDLKFAYPLDAFLEELRPLVGEQTVGDLQLVDPKRPILFVTTKDTVTRNTYFIVNAGKGKDMFKDWPLPAVVACSGAAPVFFPPVENRFLDGGVGVYTNPCLAASIEAMEYIGAEAGFTDGNVIHISLGTGYTDGRPEANAVGDFNAIDWLRYVVLESLNDGALQQVFATRAIYGNKNAQLARMDFRRYNPLLTSANVSAMLGIDLQDKPAPEVLGLDSCTPAQTELMFEIGRTYAQQIDWSKANVMPWDTNGGHRNPADIEDVPMNWANTPYAALAEPA
jgi:hypothetical protein